MEGEMAKLTAEERKEVEALCREMKEICQGYAHRRFQNDARYNEIRELLHEKYGVKAKYGSQGVIWRKLKGRGRPREE